MSDRLKKSGDLYSLREKLMDHSVYLNHEELKMLPGVNVDVLTPGALPDSFREAVLKEAVNM